MSLTIPIEEVARIPKPGLAIPGAVQFSPDGRLISYLFSPQGDLVRQLYALDAQTGVRGLLAQPPEAGALEENLSPEEKLRRERARMHELGVTSYAWSPKGGRLMLPFPDGLYVLEGAGTGQASGEPRKIVDGPVIDPQFSPDGEWIAYVSGGELWVVLAQGGGAMQVTGPQGEEDKARTRGLADYLAQEEMHRLHGFWWSPDSTRLAFEEVDETHIPIYRILHQGQDATGEGAQEDHRYPFAGQANAKVRLGVTTRAGGKPVWLDLGEDDFYLARVSWLPDGNLAVQTTDRAQSALELRSYDARSGAFSVLLREENPIWINLHNIFHPISAGEHAGEFIWASESSGFRHLYLHDAQGKLLGALTEGDWMVDALVGVDETQGWVYFTATKESPLEIHLYALQLSVPSSPPQRITQAGGTHTVVLDPDCKRFIDTHSAIDRPPSLTLRSLSDGTLLNDNTELATIYENDDPRLEQLALEPPELVTLQSRDGVLLYGAIYRPAGKGPFPTLISVYGGPHAQTVVNDWHMTSDLRAQYLRQQGFLVFVLDNRGSARRGLAFEGAIRQRLGEVELNDQVDGARWLVEQGQADPARIGIYGWSYGGFMAAMALARAPETFAAAVAGAPVTAWDGYDTHYTERYMGTPQSNPQGYADSAVMKYIPQMRGRLMLVHGLIDENVHFRHTARLINALIAARKPYELLLFPDERHSPRREGDRVFMEVQIVSFFKKTLME